MTSNEFILLENFYKFWNLSGTKKLDDYVKLAKSSFVETEQITQAVLDEYYELKKIGEKIRSINKEIGRLEITKKKLIESLPKSIVKVTSSGEVTTDETYVPKVTSPFTKSPC